MALVPVKRRLQNAVEAEGRLERRPKLLEGHLELLDLPRKPLLHARDCRLERGVGGARDLRSLARERQQLRPAVLGVRLPADMPQLHEPVDHVT